MSNKKKLLCILFGILGPILLSVAALSIMGLSSDGQAFSLVTIVCLFFISIMNVLIALFNCYILAKLRNLASMTLDEKRYLKHVCNVSLGFNWISILFLSLWIFTCFLSPNFFYFIIYSIIFFPILFFIVGLLGFVYASLAVSYMLKNYVGSPD
jgi:hypothetical protein